LQRHGISLGVLARESGHLLIDRLEVLLAVHKNSLSGSSSEWTSAAGASAILRTGLIPARRRYRIFYAVRETATDQCCIP
jgi:hypothetical protein